MEIILGAESLVPPVTGVGRYTASLLLAFLQNEDIDGCYCFADRRIWEYAPLSTVSAGHSRLLQRFARNLPYARQARKWLSDQVFEKHVAANCPGAVYHEPNYVLRRYSGPTVVTIHDLSVFKYPRSHPARRVRFYRKEIPKTVERADAIITDSEFTRREVIEEFDIPQEKVTVIHLGVDKVFRPMDEPECRETLEKYGLKYEEYLLSVGTLEPRKNFGGLIDAYCRLDGTLRDRFMLILVGPAGWRCSDLLNKIKTHEKNGVRWLDYVSEQDLPAIYSGARAFAYPSLYEGFGLPALEAACCGVPVLTSADSPMEEFCPDSSVFVNPRDISTLADVLRDILENESRYQEAKGSASKISGTYTWERCAQKTEEVYKSVLRK